LLRFDYSQTGELNHKLKFTGRMKRVKIKPEVAKPVRRLRNHTFRILILG